MRFRCFLCLVVNDNQVYDLPKWIPPDTHYLISRMLIVDPIKRITVPEILAHPWTRRGMKTYMIDTTLQAAPSLVGTVSHLLQTMNQEVIVEGLGVLDMGVVNELAHQLNVVSFYVSNVGCENIRRITARWVIIIASS